ncbi:hypothetical protein SDC9_160076 [bioreactor metagenome]|uniref:Uncharacterized protein n=1 Tax=bioreactor metagenome TaxID=1076179 RepID=A0A645FGL9_9ZZZZ
MQLAADKHPSDKVRALFDGLHAGEKTGRKGVVKPFMVEFKAGHLIASFQKLLQHVCFMLAEGRITEGQISLAPVHDAFVVRKGVKALLSVIAAQAAVSDPAKGQVRIACVYQGIVDTASAKGDRAQQGLGLLFFIGKYITG